VAIRRPWIWGFGLLLIVILAGWAGFGEYREVPWYHFKPTRWVMKDLEGRSLPQATRAWEELRRRQVAGSLSPYWEGTMVDAALAGNLTGLSWPNTDDGFKFLWEEYEAGKLRPDQIDPFFRAQTRTTYRLRSVVLVGQDIPYAMHGNWYCPKGWVLKVQNEGGRSTLFDPFNGGQTFSQGENGVLKGSAKETPGDHEIQLKFYTAFYRAKNPGHAPEIVANSKPVWESWQVQRLKVSVFGNPSKEFLTMVEAPELAAPIKSSLNIDGLDYDPIEKSHRLTIHAVNVPASLAFEVIARIDGKEYPFAEVIFRKGMYWDGTTTSGQLPDRMRPRKMDLILRSSDKVAGKTVDLFEVWKGEIVLPDVPVTNPKQ